MHIVCFFSNEAHGQGDPAIRGKKTTTTSQTQKLAWQCYQLTPYSRGLLDWRGTPLGQLLSLQLAPAQKHPGLWWRCLPRTGPRMHRLWLPLAARQKKEEQNKATCAFGQQPSFVSQRERFEERNTILPDWFCGALKGSRYVFGHTCTVGAVTRAFYSSLKACLVM